MKHLPYENWILDEPKLSREEVKSLAYHLASCKQCNQLKSGWETSKLVLTQAKLIAPVPGFSARWQKTLIKKCNTEKVRRYRITLFGLLMLAFSASLIYIVASGSFMQILANFFNSIIQTIIAVTNGLSTLGVWINKLPTVVPLAAGFIFFGLVNAFLMAAVFLFWNLKNRKTLVNETTMD
ncbi:MAG: hypothetical protein Q8N39_11400 [Pelolinea sp.]|nr:hypothetical protein [Pelolinea sp.]